MFVGVWLVPTMFQVRGGGGEVEVVGCAHHPFHSHVWMLVYKVESVEKASGTLGGEIKLKTAQSGCSHRCYAVCM